LNTTDHRVLVRTFFKEIEPNQAEVIDVVMEDTLDNYTATGTVSRKLRASRELQTFCRTYCNDPRYGCKWCKLNDIAFGTNCNNYCRRRESEAASSLPGSDVLATSYVSNPNFFTPEQDATCAELLATIVSVMTAAPLVRPLCKTENGFSPCILFDFDAFRKWRQMWQMRRSLNLNASWFLRTSRSSPDLVDK
jgi:hypothetical protein